MLAMAPLLAAWGFTIHLRCSDAQIARYLKANAALCVAWLLIVTLKYPTGNDHLVSIMWYLYYVPMLLTSTFSLFSAMRASALDRMPVTSYAKRAVLAIDAALIALVLTNNLHHMVFRFSFDDPLWSGSYTYGPGYWVVLGWIITQIALFFACSFAAARRQLRSAFVPLALIVGVLGTYTVLYILRFLIGSNLALVYSILLISCLEIALDLGILPSYYWRESMFSALPFNLRILSRTGEVALHTALFQPSAHDDALHSMLLQSDLSRRSITSFRTTAVPHTLFRGYNVTGGSALLGLNRSFNHEKEQGCMEGILLVPMDRSVIFLAKATSNLLFLLVVEVIAVPLFWFFFLTTAQPGPGFMLMAVPLAVGTIGMAGIGTLLSTITVNTRGKDVMLAVLFVPLIFPLLYACASATTAVVVGAEGYLDVFTQSMALAGGYDVIMLLVSWVLYDFVISA